LFRVGVIAADMQGRWRCPLSPQALPLALNLGLFVRPEQNPQLLGLEEINPTISIEREVR
jgi:hypothetical protein